MNSNKVLIVEDEVKVANFLKKGLEENGYLAETANNGSIGLKKSSEEKFDIILLDINIPIINGFDLCREIRKANENIPILMLTALGTIEEKLMGFEAGADDYLLKPFEFKELLARIKALLKRSEKKEGESHTLKIADLEIDTFKRTAKRKNRTIDLTAKEFALIEYLIKNKGRIISRAEIAEKIWDITFDTGTNVIDVYINFLRKKIDSDTDKKLIHTKFGMGYYIDDNEEK